MDKPKQLPGFLAEFDRDAILESDLTNVSSVRKDLIYLTCEYGHLCHLEVLIHGYDDDPRSLYEIVDVRAWYQSIQQQWPDWLFWLTPSSLWVSYLCLNPDMFERLADNSLRVELNPEKIIPQAAAAEVAAGKVLRKAELSEETIANVTEESRASLMDMFQQKRLGDYIVLHPTSGDIVTYKKQP